MKKAISILAIALLLGSMLMMIPNQEAKAQVTTLQTITLPSGTPIPWQMQYDGSRYIWFSGVVPYLGGGAIGYAGALVQIDTMNFMTDPSASVRWWQAGPSYDYLGVNVGVAIGGGYIWSGGTYGSPDTASDLLTRFDPKTEEMKYYWLRGVRNTRSIRSDGVDVWIAGTKIPESEQYLKGAIVKFNIATETWTWYNVGSIGPYDLLLDGNTIWFSGGYRENGIGKINKDGTGLTFYTTSENTVFLTKAPDGAIWFSSNIANNVGSLDPTTGKITEYDIGIPHYDPFTEDWIDAPYGLTFDAQGKLWIAGASNYSMMQFNTSTKMMGQKFSTTNKPYYPISIGNRVWCWGHGSVDMNIITLEEPTKVITRYPFQLKLWYPTQVKYGEQVNIHAELTNIGDKPILNTKLYFRAYPYSTINIGTLEPSQTYSQDFTIVANRYSIHASIRAIGQYEVTRYYWGREYSYYRYVSISADFSIRVIR